MTGPQNIYPKNTKPQEVFAWMSRESWVDFVWSKQSKQSKRCSMGLEYLPTYTANKKPIVNMNAAITASIQPWTHQPPGDLASPSVSKAPSFYPRHHLDVLKAWRWEAGGVIHRKVIVSRKCTSGGVVSAGVIVLPIKIIIDLYSLGFQPPLKQWVLI